MKYIILTIFFILMGCKSMDIYEANKILVKKGNPLGSDFIDYAVNVNSEKEFYINSITIENNTSNIEYYYKDLTTGQSSYKMQEPFKKGMYSFNFKINDTSNFSKEEFLIIQYKVKGKKVKKRISIAVDKTRTMRR